MKAALYVRVSTEAQAEKFSLPAQRRILIEHAQRQGWDYEVYEDAGISGETIAARQEMQRLLDDARARRFQVALAVEMERFSRSTELIDWLTIANTFREFGIRFGTPAQLFNPNDVEDRFLSILFGALSSREKQKFLERAMRGKREKALQGRYVSNFAPFGYRIKEGRLEVFEPEAVTVRLVFDLLVTQGMSTREIARTLTRRGIPSPRRRGRWGRSTVARILRNTAYAGRAFYNRRRRTGKGGAVRFRPEEDWIAIPVPSIVSDAVFAQAQERLQRNAAFASRNARRFDYLLRGIVRCECGRPLYGVPIKGKAYYRCATKDRTSSPSPCPARSVRADELESLVWGQVVQAISDPERVRAEARRLRESQVTQRDELLMRLEHVRAALARIPEERQTALTAFRKGWASEADLTSQMEAIRDEQKALEEERRDLEMRLDAQTADEAQASRLEAVLARFGKRLDRLTLKERFEVVHGFVERVTVHGDGRVDLALYVRRGEGDGAHCAPNVRTLWPPAAAISIARFACSCPRTSRKSTSSAAGGAAGGGCPRSGGMGDAPWRCPTTCARVAAGWICSPSTSAASGALDCGTMSARVPRARAARAMGNSPVTGRRLPSSDSSPSRSTPSRRAGRSCPVAARIPTAMGRSKAGPALRTSAGARLMVILRAGTS